MIATFLFILLEFQEATGSSPLRQRVHSKEMVKSGSKSALTELLMQAPDLKPIPLEPPPRIDISKLISPQQKIAKHWSNRVRSLSTDSASSIGSYPSTPPNTPKTPSKPIRIPYADKEMARIKSIQAELKAISEYDEFFPSPEDFSGRAQTLPQDEGIFRMSPEGSEVIENLKKPDPTESVDDDDEFEEDRRVYLEERQRRYLANKEAAAAVEYDSDFDENNETRGECYSLSLSSSGISF